MRHWFFLSFLFLVFLAGCHSQKKAHILRVGIMEGKEGELFQEAAKVAQQKYGLKVEGISFSDYAMPNTALEEGSIDLNIFEHQPYLEAQNQSRGYHLVPIAKTFLFPLAAYSHKIDHLEKIPQKAKIALPNDPTNLGRSLLLLEQAGLIRLQPDKGWDVTIEDIIDNPKRLEFLQLDAAQLPRALDDVSVAIITMTYAAEANLLPLRDGICIEKNSSPYVNIIVAQQDWNHQKDDAGKKRAEDIAHFIKAYQSPEVLKKAQDLFSGNALQGW